MAAINNWIPLSNINEISPDIDYISCDTRDFHCISRTQEYDGDTIETVNKLQSIIDTSKYIKNLNVTLLPDSLIATDDILKLLSQIQLHHPKDPNGIVPQMLKYHGYWLKYIRFVRVDKEHFYAYTTMGESMYPLNVSELKEI